MRRQNVHEAKRGDWLKFLGCREQEVIQWLKSAPLIVEKAEYLNVAASAVSVLIANACILFPKRRKYMGWEEKLSSVIEAILQLVLIAYCPLLSKDLYTDEDEQFSYISRWCTSAEVVVMVQSRQYSLGVLKVTRMLTSERLPYISYTTGVAVLFCKSFDNEKQSYIRQVEQKMAFKNIFVSLQDTSYFGMCTRWYVFEEVSNTSWKCL